MNPTRRKEAAKDGAPVESFSLRVSSMVSSLAQVAALLR
jgi:hypothetical protein